MSQRMPMTLPQSLRLQVTMAVWVENMTSLNNTDNGKRIGEGDLLTRRPACRRQVRMRKPGRYSMINGIIRVIHIMMPAGRAMV